MGRTLAPLMGGFGETCSEAAIMAYKSVLPRPLGLQARRVVVEVALADGLLALLPLPLKLD